MSSFSSVANALTWRICRQNTVIRWTCSFVKHSVGLHRPRKAGPNECVTHPRMRMVTLAVVKAAVGFIEAKLPSDDKSGVKSLPVFFISVRKSRFYSCFKATWQRPHDVNTYPACSD